MAWRPRRSRVRSWRVRGLDRTILLAILVGATTAQLSRTSGAQEHRGEEAKTSLPEPVPSTEPLTLSALSRWAEQANPRLREAAAEVYVQRGRALQAGLAPNPSLSGGALQYGGRDSQYFAQLSQEIVTKHKLGLDQAATCREVTQAELRFVRTRFEILTAVRRDYFAVLATQRRVLVANRLITLSQEFAKAGQRLQEAGEGTRGDTLLFEIEVEKAEISRQNAVAELRAVRRQLATDLGRHDAPELTVSGPLLQEPAAVLRFVEAAGYVPRNADVQIAEQEVNRARLLLQRAQVQPFPNVTVSAGYINQVMSPHNLAILQAEIPLPVWNKNQGNISAAQASITKSQQAVARTELEIARQLADAIGRFQQSEQQVVRYRDRILPRTQEAVEVSRAGIASGQLDLLRLLQAQRALIDASLSYLTALEARWLAAADIAGLVQLEEFPGSLPPPPESDEQISPAAPPL